MSSAWHVYNLRRYRKSKIDAVAEGINNHEHEETINSRGNTNKSKENGSRFVGRWIMFYGFDIEYYETNACKKTNAYCSKISYIPNSTPICPRQLRVVNIISYQYWQDDK